MDSRLRSLNVVADSYRTAIIYAYFVHNKPSSHAEACLPFKNLWTWIVILVFRDDYRLPGHRKDYSKEFGF